jgi:putative chitinase
MTRTALFEAVRPFAPGRRLTPTMVAAIDKVADLFELPNAIGDVPMPKPIALIDAQLLALACPPLPVADREATAAAVRAACARFEINTVRRIAAFIAQTTVESHLQRITENLNYEAQRMADVWPSRFSVTGKKGGRANAKAMSLAHKPEALANEVYANRMGNGPPESGDGWRYRGDGLLQLTGKNNWTGLAAAISKPLDETLLYVRTTLEGAVMSAAWFWEENDINRLADTPGVTDETKAINGGDTGLAERKRVFDLVVAELLRRGA